MRENTTNIENRRVEDMNEPEFKTHILDRFKTDQQKRKEASSLLMRLLMEEPEYQEAVVKAQKEVSSILSEARERQQKKSRK